jgi:hypothetical protein
MRKNIQGMVFKDAVELIAPEFGKFHSVITEPGELGRFIEGRINPELFEFFEAYCPTKGSAIIAGVILGYWIANNEMTRH